MVSKFCSRIWWQMRSSCVTKLENFESSRHPVIQGVCPLGRGTLKKRNDREKNHSNGEYGNMNLQHWTVHTANPLCIYGAVSKWCGPKSGEASENRPETAREMSP